MQANLAFHKLVEDEKLLREFQKMMNIKDPFQEYLNAKLRERSFAERIFKTIPIDSGPER